MEKSIKDILQEVFEKRIGGLKGADMQEVFEKIIEKLNSKKAYFQRFYECEGKSEHDADLNKSTQLAFDDAIEIVKQEAEKFGTDTNVGSNGWIPCSSGRLPEENTDVEVTIEEIADNVGGKRYYNVRSWLQDVIYSLRDFPTAYDVDKVVDQLKEVGQKMSESKSIQKYGKSSPANHRYYKAVSVKQAIGIVKGGGVDE